MSDDYISVFDGMDKATVDRILNRGKYRTQLIQKLEAENIRLREALEKIANTAERWWHLSDVRDCARAALEGKE